MKKKLPQLVAVQEQVSIVSFWGGLYFRDPTPDQLASKYIGAQIL